MSDHTVILLAKDMSKMVWGSSDEFNFMLLLCSSMGKTIKNKLYACLHAIQFLYKHKYWLSLGCLLLKWPPHLDLGKSEVRNQNLHPETHEWQGAQVLGLSSAALPGASTGIWDWDQCFDVGFGTASCGLMCCTTVVAYKPHDLWNALGQYFAHLLIQVCWVR